MFQIIQTAFGGIEIFLSKGTVRLMSSLVLFTVSDRSAKTRLRPKIVDIKPIVLYVHTLLMYKHMFTE